jgi:hypothetical protein
VSKGFRWALVVLAMALTGVVWLEARYRAHQRPSAPAESPSVKPAPAANPPAAPGAPASPPANGGIM